MHVIIANFEYNAVIIMLEIGCKYWAFRGYFKVILANFPTSFAPWALARALPWSSKWIETIRTIENIALKKLKKFACLYHLFTTFQQ